MKYSLNVSLPHGVRRSRRCQLLTSQAGFSFISFAYVLQAESFHTATLGFQRNFFFLEFDNKQKVGTSLRVDNFIFIFNFIRKCISQIREEASGKCRVQGIEFGGTISRIQKIDFLLILKLNINFSTHQDAPLFCFWSNSKKINFRWNPTTVSTVMIDW